MQEVQLPVKRYQTITIIAAVVGFLLGALIPAFAFGKGYWSCPFGEGVIRIGVFVLLTGILSSLLTGNAAALLVIFIARLRRLSTKSR
jgi:F0F1-type ATP synthase membrane subunit c/vacuolar-type H+-ATPase subunit K